MLIYLSFQDMDDAIIPICHLTIFIQFRQISLRILLINYIYFRIISQTRSCILSICDTFRLPLPHTRGFYHTIWVISRPNRLSRNFLGEITQIVQYDKSYKFLSSRFFHVKFYSMSNFFMGRLSVQAVPRLGGLSRLQLSR